MPIDGRKLRPGEPIYTFVDNEGTNIHIHAERLRQHCLIVKPPVRFIPTNRQMAEDFLARNIVSMDRCLELLGKDKLDPIIFCHDGKYTDGRPDCMLVDGHHRFTVASLAGIPRIPAHILEQKVWRPFRVVNIRDLTQDELEAIPIRKRNY